MKMDSNEKKLSVINKLCGKNRHLQALRKSGVLYRRAAKLLKQYKESVEDIVNVVSPSELQAASASPELFDGENTDMASSVDPELMLFQETQDLELNLSESEDEASMDDDQDIASEDDENDPDYTKMTSEEGLRYWALARSESHASLKSLLKYLRANTDLRVPKDPRTLLRTRRNPAILSSIGNGKFWYNGIRHCLTSEMRKHTAVPQTLQYDLNIDGLPLHTRSKTQFWPILLKIVDQPDWPVMIVAIYCGPTKPESNELYLRQLVDEINLLSSTGLMVGENAITLKLRAIIADTPARAFIKGVQGHTGRHSCLKCCCEGESVSQRMVFLDTSAAKRTHKGFLDGDYILHCTGSTPLIDLDEFDIILDMIVVDRLHQIDIGLTKKLLHIWYMGVLKEWKRWNRQQREEFKQRLLKQKLPFETNQKMRPIDDLAYWKGSDCKTFLHYVAPVVLEGLLSEQEYKHFMLYFCAITIFSSTEHKEHWKAAGTMLKTFVETFADVYHKKAVTSNVHSLIHLEEEVERFGPLDYHSTYAYERKLGNIKNRLIRINYRCLEQAIRRISEFENFTGAQQNDQPFRQPFYTQRGQTITMNVRKNLKLRNDDVNDLFMTNKNVILKFVSVRQEQDKLMIVGKMFSRIFEYFDEHISSTKLHIYSVYKDDLKNDEVLLECSDVKLKFARTIKEADGNMVLFPLLNTLND
ncbi:uncharacterized protein LOC133391667 [Anopheles gambiae]|uniref:uncharacterized protein LOC133391611 n=1 Tax=Anopheles gambiae TaxID=7165 RepID=UPI002AC91B5E|nr:uncharacterized protein LOC133391611 [Anopheles gambiae]XP_061503263.1 uncharacterized protein LOC133391667 [Anopheles gambiae]